MLVACVFRQSIFTIILNIFVFVPPEGQQQQKARHRWSEEAACPEGQARDLSVALQAGLSSSCRLDARAEGTWRWTIEVLDKKQNSKLLQVFLKALLIVKWEVVLRIHTCKRQQQHPEEPEDDLAVLKLLALSNQASPGKIQEKTLGILLPFLSEWHFLGTPHCLQIFHCDLNQPGSVWRWGP